MDSGSGLNGMMQAAANTVDVSMAINTFAACSKTMQAPSCAPASCCKWQTLARTYQLLWPGGALLLIISIFQQHLQSLIFNLGAYKISFFAVPRLQDASAHATSSLHTGPVR